MNYVDPNYEPPLFGRPAEALTRPSADWLKTVDLTAQQIAEMNRQIQRRAVFTDPISQTLTFTDAAPDVVCASMYADWQASAKFFVPVNDWQALAEFRADVIAELQNEIAALKMDRDAKMDLARGLHAIIKDEPPTKGDVLARAMRADSVTGAYGR